MSNLSHYLEEEGGIERHVIELPPQVVDDELLDALDRLASGILSTKGARIRVDCRHVARLSEGAIAILMAASARARRTGGLVGLDVRANPRLREALKMTGLWSGDDDEQGGPAGVTSRVVPPPAPRTGERAEPKPPDEGDGPSS